MSKSNSSQVAYSKRDKIAKVVVYGLLGFTALYISVVICVGVVDGVLSGSAKDPFTGSVFAVEP